MDNKIVFDKNKQIFIKNWPSAESLFVKWGYDVQKDKIEVRNLDYITPELSAWGITWKY